MKSALDQIEEIKKQGYTLDFSKVFDHALENYKKIAIYAGLILLVFSVLFAIAFSAIIVGVLGIEKVNLVNYLKIQPANLSAIQLVYYIVGTTLISALFSPFGAGFLKMADCADRDTEFNVSTIFTYYKTKYLAPIFIATAIIALFNVVISTFLEIQKLEGLAFLISISLSFFTFLTIPLIIFGDLKAIDAIKSSFIIISKQPLVILGLIITIIVALIVGVLALIIGLIFTVPFMYSMTYAIYCSIIDYKNEDLVDTIGRSDLE